MAATALSVRRWVVIASPVLAGIFLIVGVVADPAPGDEGRDLWEQYAAEPDRLEWKSVGYHFAYLLFAPAVFSLVGLVRGRGAWIANVAGVLGILGLTTLPGLLVIDYYDSAIGRELGVDATVRVNAAIEEGWGILAIAVPAFVGFILSLPLACVAAWRAGLLPWWAPAAVVVGPAVWIATRVTLPGAIVFALMLCVLAVALSRIGLATWDVGRPAQVEAPEPT